MSYLYIYATEVWNSDSYTLEKTVEVAPEDIALAENEETISILWGDEGDVVERSWPAIAWPKLATLYERIKDGNTFDDFERELESRPLYGDDDYILYNWGLRRYLRQA